MELEKSVIEKMDIEDLEQVLSIEASSSVSPWSKKMFVEELRNPVAYCFVMKDGGLPEHQIVGFICFRNIRDESELLNIAVHPQHRQLGIGKNLMQFYIDYCKPMQIKSYYLEVNASNSTAIHLYKLFSFQPMGMRKRFYQGKFDALLMIKKAERL
jgi:ribosomal-protein-alanine N-acetyltransferase